MRHFLISVLLLGLFAGCSSTKIGPHRIDVQQGNALNQDNVARLKPGLTRSQVRFLLGTPLVVDPFRTDRWDYVYLFYKAGKLAEQKRITLFFEGDTLARMVSEAGSSPHFLSELEALYRKGASVWSSHGDEQRMQRPWRFQRRLNRIVTGVREREVQKVRAHLANEMMGRGAAQVKLRPAGLVALEWARLSTEPLPAGKLRGEGPNGPGRSGGGTPRPSQEV